MASTWLKEKKIHLMMLAGTLFIAGMFSSEQTTLPEPNTPLPEWCTEESLG